MVQNSVMPRWLDDLLTWPVLAETPGAASQRRLQRLDQAIADVLADSDLRLTAYTWLRHYEDRRLPMPLDYA